MKNKLSIKNLAEFYEKPPEKEQNKDLNKDKRNSVIPTENFLNSIKIFEESVKRNKDREEEEKKRQQLYEQNRLNMRLRMRRLKQFILENKKRQAAGPASM